MNLTKQEIQELMRVKIEKESAHVKMGNDALGLDGESHAISYQAGGASAIVTLAECLSLALETLELIDLDYEEYSGKAFGTVNAIESKLKGGFDE